VSKPPVSMHRAAARTAFWSAVEGWAVRGISALAFLVLARLLEPEAFGLMALAMVFILIVQMLADQGFAAAIIQRPTLEPEHLDSAFWATVVLGAALGGLTILLAGPIASLFGEPRLAPVLRWLALGPPLMALTVVQHAILRRELRFASLTLRQTLAAAIGGLAGIGMALAGFGVWSLVAQMLVGQAVGLAVLWSVSPWCPRARFSTPHFRAIFEFGLKVLGTGLLRIVGFQADRVLIGYVLGPVELGYYSVAQRVLLIVSDLLAGSFERAVLPLFARVQAEPDRVRRGLFTAGRVLGFAAFPAYFGIIATAPEIALVGLGPQWREADTLIQLLAIMSLCFALSFFFGHLLTALDRAGWRFWVTASNAALNIAAVLVAVPFGVEAVAAALGLVQVVIYGVELAVLRRAVPFGVAGYLRNLLVPAAAAALMAGTVWAARLALLPHLAPAALLAASIAIGVAVYALATWLLAPQLYREVIDLLRALLQRPMPPAPAEGESAT
jgi:O-antigen/teichoic acid export membrane protein